MAIHLGVIGIGFAHLSVLLIKMIMGDNLTKNDI
jgi:hypothetical protein